MNNKFLQLENLPPGWKWVKLGEVCRVFAGSSAPQGEEFFDASGPFFFRVSDLGRSVRTDKLMESQYRLSQKALEVCQLVLAHKGTILFPKSGAAIATNNRAMLGIDGYIVGHLMAIEPMEYTIPEWIYYILCQIDMMNYSDNTGYPSLKQSVVQKIRIPLAPLSEQKRIVKILEEKLSAVEKAKKAAEEKLELINKLPASFLRKAFRGEL
jgi:restriction endonuclease S subunit